MFVKTEASSFEHFSEDKAGKETTPLTVELIKNIQYEASQKYKSK